MTPVYDIDFDDLFYIFIIWGAIGTQNEMPAVFLPVSRAITDVTVEGQQASSSTYSFSNF